MEDFDIFTDQIEFTKPYYKNLLHKFVYESPPTPCAPNYQSGQKLVAEEYLSEDNDLECAFHLSEAVSASIRIMATYREELMKSADNKILKITKYLKPIDDLTSIHSVSKSQQELIDCFASEDMADSLQKCHIEDVPFHRKYLRFSKDNNAENFLKILKELPKEWTIIQLTAPYNPNENLKLVKEYRNEMDSLHLSVFANDYSDDVGPFTINIPANPTKGEEKPLFVELYSILEENYNTIYNAQFLNNKRLVQNYWTKREGIDLRMMSAINAMEKYWLGGWSSLLTGRLVDHTWKQRIVTLVDNAIADWGFIKLTKKQRASLYNLIESCQSIPSQQFKSCVRRILTENGNISDIRQHLPACEKCNRNFVRVKELCFECLSGCFEALHHFTVVDGIRAFSQVASRVKDGNEWAGLKKAKRHPVVLIVDEMLDSFPWESISILKHHPVSRLENIHFLYYLFKSHQPQIVDGYFHMKGNVGRYVINPEKNLDRMEQRMRSFVSYWCREWRGHVSQPPPPSEFTAYLTDADIFLYCGHGDGCHLAKGDDNRAGVEGVSKAKAVCILSGCGSVRLIYNAGRAPPLGAHRRLHVAGCPTVVGMLWEVTDLEVDKVVTTLLSLCIPSDAAVPWPAVGKAKWSLGELDTSVEQKCQLVRESDLLRAVSQARGVSKYLMISSAMVVRGLPAAMPDS